MKYLKFSIPLLFLTVFSFMQFSCTGMYDAFTNAQRLQFKLGSVDGFTIANVKINHITHINQLSLLDAANLTAAFARGELPANFTLNVLAKNPNDGTGGTKSTSAVLKSLAWRLLIDDKETVTGNIGNSIEIPGVGQTTTIPIAIGLDLMKFFKDQGYEGILNLALALGGAQGSAAKLTLKATPTVDTILGPITYPGEINIIDKEFRNQ